MSSYENRFKQSIEEAKRLHRYKEIHGEIKLLDAEFCDNPHRPLRIRGTFFKIPSGNLYINNWIKGNGFVKTTMKESTCLLTVGILHETGSWIYGKCKNYWLKPL